MLCEMACGLCSAIFIKKTMFQSDIQISFSSSDSEWPKLNRETQDLDISNESLSIISNLKKENVFNFANRAIF